VSRLSPEFGLALVCRVLGVARSTANYKSIVPVEDLAPLKQTILSLLRKHRRFGIRRMFHLLIRNGNHVSRSRVRECFVQLGILRKQRSTKARTTDSRHLYHRYENLVKDLEIVHPEQVWVADVTYLKINGRFAYLGLLMDVYTRYIVGWCISWHNDANLTLTALRAGLYLGRSPLYHHSDQGSNYACKEYERVLLARGISISMAAVGKPEENGYAERLNRTVKEEEIYFTDYVSLREAQQSIGGFIKRYNTDRIHSSLSYKTPSEVFLQYLGEGSF
jgi:transposase InsO family protein